MITKPEQDRPWLVMAEPLLSLLGYSTATSAHDPGLRSGLVSVYIPHFPCTRNSLLNCGPQARSSSSCRAKSNDIVAMPLEVSLLL